jgi:hypothetical protein
MPCRSLSACISCHPMTIGNDRGGLNPRRNARSPSTSEFLCSIRERVAVARVDADGLRGLAGTGDEAGVAGDAVLRPLLSELRKHLKELTVEDLAWSLTSILSEGPIGRRSPTSSGTTWRRASGTGFGWGWSRRLARRRPRVRTNVGVSSTRKPLYPSPSGAGPRTSSSRSLVANGARRACRPYEPLSSAAEGHPSLGLVALDAIRGERVDVLVSPRRQPAGGTTRPTPCACANGVVADPQKWGPTVRVRCVFGPGRKKPPHTGFPD